MKAWIWFRALAVILAIFTLGHTVGTWHAVTAAPEEAAVISAMQSYRLPVMGFMRSYGDFYRGFSVTITVLLIVLTVIAWQLGSMSRRSPEAALPISITLLIGCVANAVVAWNYFFAAPMLMSAATVVCAGVAVALLKRGQEVV
jgi:hypothetical protein